MGRRVEIYLFRDSTKMMPPFCARCALVDFLLMALPVIGKSRTALLAPLLCD